MPAIPSVALVGRERELNALNVLFAEVTSDGARTAVVTGEAGIGKTRLIAEFVAGLPDTTIVTTGQCVDLQSDAPPYLPVTSALRRLMHDVGRDAFARAAGSVDTNALGLLLPELAAGEPVRAASGPAAPTDRGFPVLHGLPALSSAAPERTGGGDRLYAAIASLIERVASEHPLILIIEDVHWADQATLGVLRFLVRTLDRTAVLIVLSLRADELERESAVRAWMPELERNRGVARIALGRISRHRARQLVAALRTVSGAAVDIDDDAVYERSDGIPFFIEELVGASGDGVPENLRDLLLVRYEGLDPDTQRMLRLLAAGGNRVEHRLLVAVSDTAERDRIDVAARAAIAANLLHVDETAYTFRHALVREAIHDQLLPGERVRFHTRYAEALAQNETGADASEISYHWMAAHNMGNAFTASLEAMAQARRSFAHAAAARMGERALELWDGVPDAERLAGRSRMELLAETAYLLRNAGQSERALALVDEALAIAQRLGATAEQRAGMLRNKASFLANVGRTDAVVAQLREALAALADGEPTILRANVLGELAARLMLEARFAEAIETADRARDEAAAVDSGERVSVALNIRGYARFASGEIEPGLADLAEAGRLAAGSTGSARLRFWVNQSDALLLLGRFDEALHVAEEGVAGARALGVERTTGAYLIANAAAALFALGRAEPAGALLDQGLSLDVPAGFGAPLHRLKLQHTLWHGEVEVADRLLNRWRSALATQAKADMQSRLAVAGVAAEIALERGDTARAAREVEVLFAADHLPYPACDLPLLAVAARAGAGESDIRTMLAACAHWPTAPVYTAICEAELGSTTADGSRGGDPGLWRTALDACELPTAPAQLWPYAAYRLAIAELEHGDRAAARRTALNAKGRAEAIGAGLLARRVDELLERAGLSERAPGVEASGPGADASALTDRERQVLDLLAQGLSNRQIAERLFISPKTASVHVSSILRKAGASSRTEAVYRLLDETSPA